MKNILVKNSYRHYSDKINKNENEQFKIYPDQIDKKNELDTEIRNAINTEFFDMLRQEKFGEHDQNIVEEYVKNYLKTKRYFFVDKKDEEAFIYQIVNDIFGFGVIQKYILDPSIQEIFVEGRKGIFYEQNGARYKSPLTFKSETAIRSVISKILAPINRKADESTPIVDARLPDGSRVAITLPPVALNGPTINIRKFKEDKFILEDYVKLGSMTEQMKEFLQLNVQAGLNILIAGGTGSGKTTLLNALCNEIPYSNDNDGKGMERIITIEDSAELKIPQPFVASWETKSKNAEGYGEVDSSSLLKHALRNAPDRIILGEMRDKVAFDVLQAVNTGHDGTMSTIHCENAKGAISRFADLVASSGILTPIEAAKQFGDSFHLIVFTEKYFDKDDNRFYRKVTQITYVAGSGASGASKLNLNIKEHDKIDPNKVFLQDLYVFNKIRKKFICKGFFPRELENKLLEKGLHYPESLFKAVK